jgi:glycosyltransferase involved in cell wall biosynthesis
MWRKGMEQTYSVLMSVYYREKAEYLRQSIESVVHQTISPDEFMIVCDGTLTDELDAVLEEYREKYPKLIKLLRLKENKGLGKSLNAGLSKCRNELIARMDSDDICFLDRMERELRAINEKQAAIVSGPVVEFEGSIENVLQQKTVPQTDEEIRRYMRRRNPFNHPAVMFRRSCVMAAGGYKDFPMFEDYYLWVRMLKKNFTGYNLQEPVLYMRAGEELYERRGGVSYARQVIRFRKYLLTSGVSNIADFIVTAGGHALVALMPAGLRKCFYQKALRK